MEQKEHFSKVQVRKLKQAGKYIEEEKKIEKLIYDPLYFPEEAGVNCSVAIPKVKAPRTRRIHIGLNRRKAVFVQINNDAVKHAVSGLKQKKLDRRARHKQMLTLNMKLEEEELFELKEDQKEEDMMDELEKLKQELEEASNEIMSSVKKEMQELDLQKTQFMQEQSNDPEKLKLHMIHARPNNLA